jgi:hypothetical protein
MLAGLLRLRGEMGESSLGRVLWNQVRFLLAESELILEIYKIQISARNFKSLVWLFLATVAEVPPTVSLGILFS